MVAPALNPVATWEFEGEILVLHHPTTISVKYEVPHKPTARPTRFRPSPPLAGGARHQSAMPDDCLGAQAVVHCGSIRQTAGIIAMDKQHIRTGDKTIARFRFVRHPEYIRVGSRIIFREGRTKAVGTVQKLIA